MKKIFVVLLILSNLFLLWCINEKKSDDIKTLSKIENINKVEVDTWEIAQINSLDKDIITTEKTSVQLDEDTNIITKDSSNISEATINKWWKKYSSDKNSVFSTENWIWYTSSKENFSFSIEFPSNWRLDYSVFYDSENNKIAELWPGIVALKNNQKCFDVKEEINEIMKFISQNNINIGGKNGILKVYESVAWNGNERRKWYPNIYCLMEWEKAFVMSFYNFEFETENRELFERVLATLKFE